MKVFVLKGKPNLMHVLWLCYHYSLNSSRVNIQLGRNTKFNLNISHQTITLHYPWIIQVYKVIASLDL